LRDLGNLVRLDVRPELHAALTHRRLPAMDVPLQAIEINQQSGRIEIKNSIAWLGARQSD
jgi:hypothetical protein